jgi:hypothetical protein
MTKASLTGRTFSLSRATSPTPRSGMPSFPMPLPLGDERRGSVYDRNRSVDTRVPWRSWKSRELRRFMLETVEFCRQGIPRCDVQAILKRLRLLFTTARSFNQRPVVPNRSRPTTWARQERLRN